MRILVACCCAVTALCTFGSSLALGATGFLPRGRRVELGQLLLRLARVRLGEPRSVPRDHGGGDRAEQSRGDRDGQWRCRVRREPAGQHRDRLCGERER